MAYKALYRSYRPQTFEELAGQQHIVKTLKNAVRQNKIAHAYLFCGPRGTGKTTVAKILAKAINCTCQDKNHIPCDECENCQSITNGTHPDIIEIDAASNNGVDEVRELIEKVKYAPIRGKYKVYIIDEVHMMSTGAFNALLKTLEEPLTHVVFVLATTEPQKILPTIISRCQRFDFNRIKEKDIINRLKTVLDEEHIQCEDESLELIASLADGGMRDALSILEQCLAYSPQLKVSDINEIYGIVSQKQKIEYLKYLMNKNVPSVLNKLEEMFQTGIDIKRLTIDLIDILKDIVIYKNTQNLDNLFVLKKDEIDQIVPYITIDDTFEYIDILIQADQQYKYASNAKIYFEIACLKIANQVNNEKIQVIERKQDEQLNNKDNAIEDKINEIQINDDTTKQLEPKKQSSINISKTEIKSEEPQINIINDVQTANNTIDKIEENIEQIKNIDVDFNDVLNILVQANRKILNNIQEKWGIIRKYQFNLNTAKLASMLCDGQPVAASENGLIIAFEFQPSVNQVNNVENYIELKKFLKEILGMEFDFIGVLKSDWPNMRNKFIELKHMNQLPKPRPITLKHIKIENKKENVKQLTEAEEFGIKLFGDIVEIKEKK